MLVAFFCVAGVTYAEKVPLEEMNLFGVKLKEVKREDLHKGLLQAGLTLSRDYKSSEWSACYDVNGKFSDAKYLFTTFDHTTGEFVSATYVFPGNRSCGDVQHLSKLLAEEYGSPTKQKVDPQTGACGYSWRGDVWGLLVFLRMPKPELLVMYANVPALKRWRAPDDEEDGTAGQ